MNGTYSLPSAPPAREANRDIIFMMLPLLVVACYLYGGRPAVMCCVAVATAVVCDHLTAWMRGRTHDSAENSSIPMALVTTMMPVSYTHLDVYKRQVSMPPSCSQSLSGPSRSSSVGQMRWLSGTFSSGSILS